FEDALAAANLLPGPASTQLAIYCAWTVGSRAGALVGGLAFVLPGLVATILLAALFLGSPPDWLRGAGAGAGAAVAVVAVHAALPLLRPVLARRARLRARGLLYAALGAAAAALLGPWLVAVLLACGVIELGLRIPVRAVRRAVDALLLARLELVAALGAAAGGLVWTGLKVGALSYGGGFVIVPLMQADAVDAHGWMSEAEFLNAVAIGQVTPGPVVHTVAVVGYAAAGLAGALLVSAIAFAPSFAFVLLGAPRLERLASNVRVRAFLDGAGPAAAGAILGVAVPLARALDHAWQVGILGGACLLLLGLRRGVVLTLVAAGAAGVLAVQLGAPLAG
ncbi:MAG: chromate transporter, partial [Gaiella sp.]